MHPRVFGLLLQGLLVGIVLLPLVIAFGLARLALGLSGKLVGGLLLCGLDLLDELVEAPVEPLGVFYPEQQVGFPVGLVVYEGVGKAG